MKDDACLFPLNLCAFHANVDRSEDTSIRQRYTQDLPPPSIYMLFSFILYKTLICPSQFVFLITMSYYSLEGYVKEAALMYIDVIHNLMHNTHTAVSYYTHNG